MKPFFLSAFLLTILFSPLYGQNVRYPFPHHTQYKGLYIRPSNYTQDQLDKQTEAFYDGWKKKYLKPGCEKGQYYVWFESGNTLTVSEAMGYGMVIVPLMAGYDPDAQKYFDGLNRFYLAHPSHIMPHLMAWKQVTGCKDADGPDSATDGDMDIAFGLLLAYAQWGDTAYLHEAILIIRDIMGKTAAEGDINQHLYSVKLGDWVTGGGLFMNSTRTSDFIMDHFRAFGIAVHDTAFWQRVTDTCYAYVADMQKNYSPNTGLLPDFIIHLDKTPEPAFPNFLEGRLDGNYSYNACRDPWRLTNDYLINGDNRAKKAVLKIDKWLYHATEGSVNRVYAGYYLNGKKAAGWSDISFTAPFAVGAMLNTAQQSWLNKLYSRILLSKVSSGGYYDNTLKMLAMITLSGNYWVPPRDILNSIHHPTKEPEKSIRIYPSVTQNYITVKSTRPTVSFPLNVFVYNTIGKIVIHQTDNHPSGFQISLEKLPKGMYVVLITDKNQNRLATTRIIKP